MNTGKVPDLMQFLRSLREKGFVVSTNINSCIVYHGFNLNQFRVELYFLYDNVATQRRKHICQVQERGGMVSRVCHHEKLKRRKL